MSKPISFNRLLLITFLFIGCMIAARILVTGTIIHLFLLWNIFLAWIPFILSRYFMQYRKKETWKQFFLFISWLVFFPNALYIVTDLIHLKDRGGAPVWYDAILLFTSSLIGLLMAYASLFRAEKFLLSWLGRRRMVYFMPAIIVIASFGVYLGRFDRWNSWDVLHNPLGLVADILEYVTDPVENLHTWGTTAVFSAFFYLMYILSKWVQVALSKVETK